MVKKLYQDGKQKTLFCFNNRKTIPIESKGKITL